MSNVKNSPSSVRLSEQYTTVKMEAECSASFDIPFKISRYKSKQEVELIVPRKCKTCPFEAISSVLFLKHMTVGTGHCYYYKCDECHSFFRSYESRQTHKYQQHSSVTKTTTYQCKCCAYHTKNKHDLQRHISFKHLTEAEKQAKWHKCELCSYHSPRKFNIKKHTLKKHSERLATEWFKCERCVFKTKIQKDLLIHIEKRHTSNPKVACKICDLLVEKSYLKLHISKKHLQKTKEHKCEFCPKGFKWEISLYKHVQREHSSAVEKQWQKCHLCDYKTLNKLYLEFHIVSKHTVQNGDGLQCIFCQERCASEQATKEHILEKHTRSTTEAKGLNQVFSCGQCEATFKQKASLTSHNLKMHNVYSEGAKLLKCDSCDYMHFYKSRIAQHAKAKHNSYSKPTMP